jgi:translation elongation factor EF-G
MEIDIPANMMEKSLSMRAELIEKVASLDDGLMEVYFETGELSNAELKS